MEQRVKECASASQTDDDIGEVWRKWVKSGIGKSIPDTLMDPYTYFNTRLPSLAPVERLFLLGKKVLSPYKTKLSDTNFELMVMMAANKKISKF